MQQLLTEVTKNIDTDFQDCQPLVKVASKLHTKTSTMVMPPIIVVIIILLITVKFSHFFITLIGMLYPSYMTFKAINTNDQTLCKKWLTYWIVFGFLISFDKFLSILLFFLPGFNAFKLLFIIWLFYPRTNGASVIYENFLKNFLNRVKIYLKKQSNMEQTKSNQNI